MRASAHQRWSIRPFQIVLVACVCAAMSGCANIATLDDAARLGNVKAVNEFLDKGAKIDEHDVDGYTALHWAAYAGQLETVKVLLERGADIEAPDNGKLTPLMVAVCYLHPNVTEYLLEKRAKVNALDQVGWTALDYAISNIDAKTTKILLVHDADVNAGVPAITVADKYKATAIAKLLRQHGAK
jgi:ankyrin repeat protein